MASTPVPADPNANHDAEIISVVVVFTVITVAAFAARVLTRVWKRIPLGIDDALLAVALVSQTSYRLGRH